MVNQPDKMKFDEVYETKIPVHEEKIMEEKFGRKKNTGLKTEKGQKNREKIRLF